MSDSDLGFLAMHNQEEFLDLKCGVCDRNGVIAESSGYCGMCDQRLCASCLSHHSECSFTSTGHEDKGDSDTTGSRDTGVECPDHCQTISMYCGRHENLCCHLCVVLKHDDTCKASMTYIPKAAKGILASKEFQDTGQDLDQLIASFCDLEAENSEFLKSLRVNHEESVENIEEFHNEIIKRSHDLKKASLTELKLLHNDLVQAVQGELAYTEKAKKELQLMKESMQLPSSMNESQLFIKMKNGLKIVSTYKDSSARLRAHRKTLPTFERNRSLMTIVQSATSLGKIDKDNTTMSKECEVGSQVAAKKGRCRIVIWSLVVMVVSVILTAKVFVWTPPTTPTYGPELAKMMYVGATVMRGRDWKYGNQDQPGGKGTVKGIYRDTVLVKWDNSRYNYEYRMGLEGAYDLMFVPGTYKHPSQK